MTNVAAEDNRIVADALDPRYRERQVVLSLGMGVDSVALLVRWILNATLRGFPLSALTVVTAMTGEEHDRTREYMERYLLPLMRKHRIRYVQICRAGQKRKHGYVVLSDTRRPDRMHMIGPWRLSYEMKAGGTLPSVRKGRRWCSDRAKGDPIDWWVRDNMQPGYIHVTGYAAEEGRRAARDAEARLEKEGEGKTVPCLAWYPLMDWGMNRSDASKYLKQVFKLAEGEEWPRSCCTWCPFSGIAGSRAELVARWRAQPEVAAFGLELEYTALALNENIGLFGTGRTAFDVALEEGLDHVVDIALARIEAHESWDVLEIRRLFTAKDDDPSKKGSPFRSVRAIRTGTRRDLLDWMRANLVAELEVDHRYGIIRAWTRRRAPKGKSVVYPAAEHLHVLVPTGVDDKERSSFARRWNEFHALTLF
ncbi:hypothetical protein [Saccharothrix sp.]|uniref:hypothetical protein n=1 Tax=Saccharothrix sp. TaxID=1873460 RepID=UPI002810BDBC|nr:hypothetical protein [Saccharothrix sp.]